MEHFTTYIQKARIRSGKTQKDLAKALGYSSAQFVSNWERQCCLPPMDKVKTIAAFLGIDYLDAKQRYLSTKLEMLEKRIR